MMLTVQDLRNEFGLEEECKFLFHNKYCQGAAHVYGTFSGSSLVFKFDNKIDYFEFLVEAKSLIENNIWKEIYFCSKCKVLAKENKDQESLCMQYGMDIDKRTQEILEQYIVKNNNGSEREKIILQETISNTEEILSNLKQLGKLINLL